MKKFLFAMMAAVMAFSFVSCSDPDDDNEPEEATLSAIYGKTYEGTYGVFSATLKVTDADKIYLVGGPAVAPTTIDVEDQAYTVTLADDVYTVTTTNNSADFSFTLKINEDGTVTLGYGTMSVEMSEVTDSDNNEPEEASLSAIYGTTYTGTMGTFSATLKVTDADAIYLVGGPNSVKVIDVEDQAYTVTLADDVYTVTTTNSGADFSFTLTINEDGTVTLGYGQMSVTMSEYVSVADKIAGTYTGNASFAVMGITASFEDVDFVITKLTDTTVSITVPSVTYETMSMTFPEYTLTETGAVTEADGTYTVSYEDYSTTNDSGKTIAISSVSVSITDDVLTFSASEKYGSMPKAGTLSFTSTSKE